MEQLMLEFTPSLKKGDKVVILDKSIGDPIGSGPYGEGFYVGYTEVISKVYQASADMVFHLQFNRPPKEGQWCCRIKSSAFLVRDVKKVKR